MSKKSSLPLTLQEIAQVAGASVAWEMSRAVGGTTVYLPHTPKEGHWLVELVGMDAARKVCAHFRVANTGVRVLIPMAKFADNRARLIKALEDGMSAPQAASVAGMHERSAFRARKKLGKKNDKQGDLF